MGLARSGLATVRALAASGAQMTAWDSNPDAIEELRLSRAQSRDVDAYQRVSTSLDTNGVLDFQDPLEIDLAGFDGVVVSPGVPLNRHPIAKRAADAGVPVIGDIELFAQARASLPPHKVVGITGTNGKSTTTALIHHIVKAAGIPTTLGGNIGLPILGQDPLAAGGIYVLELSSYQIDLTFSLDCDVAVLLNITPDHLDRYDGFAGYAGSKMRLFEMQSSNHFAILGFDDPEVRSRSALPLWFNRGEKLVLSTIDEITDQSAWPTLQGPHNAQNAAVAIAVTRALDIDDAMIFAALKTYPGLPHRMEIVLERGGVLFVNDSKATNPTSTAPALAAYPKIHWILGGQAKTNDLDACAPHFDHVVAAYTIGDSAQMFADLLAPHMVVSNCGDLKTAVGVAAEAARSGETVLLSPACASFDQFRDFEARGDAFRVAVEALG
nr:UDP-N-acetylmuramoyl-L-alanine--D-glutamate ligase [Sphingobium boeckii]